MKRLLVERKRVFGDGVVALDLGANVGAHTVEWSKLMYGWGSIIAVEAQERIFYALAGNVAINNCFNSKVIWGAIGNDVGFINVPVPNYLSPGSFGSMEIKQSDKNEFIGQTIDYTPEKANPTRLFTIDSLLLPRIDLIKIDVEGMEMDALNGGKKSIDQHKPIMLIEKIKTNETDLRTFLGEAGYQIFEIGINFLAIHETDEIRNKIIRHNAK